METPLLEDRAALERGGRLKDSPFQLFDTDGTLLVLRPDLTLPVARLVAGRVDAGGLPARFRYAAPVVREEPSLRGQPRQFTQLGVELVGTDGAAGCSILRNRSKIFAITSPSSPTAEAPPCRLTTGI